MTTQIVTKLVPLRLVGVDGNAFMVIGAFRAAAKKAGTPQSEIDAVVNEAKEGDYDHLLATFMANTTPDDEANDIDEEWDEGYYGEYAFEDDDDEAWDDDDDEEEW